MDVALNAAFFLFHSIWIVFNLVGWGWRRTRRWHLATVSLTALSWFGLGYWYGWGYCPCTDWHWQVRERLGLDNPPSYVQLLVRELIGPDLSPRIADILTVGAFLPAAAASVVLNIRDRVRPKAEGRMA
jgi:hypothetical protein